MVASGQVEILFIRGIGRQSGRVFGAFAQVIGKTSTPFLFKNVVPDAKCVRSDLLEFTVPGMADVVSGGKKLKTASECVGRQTLGKPLDNGSKKRLPAESLQENLRNQPIDRQVLFLQLFPTNQVKEISLPKFCGLFSKSRTKSPVVDDALSSREQKIYPNFSLYENSIEFKFQADENYDVDFRRTSLALKLKFVEVLGYESYNIKKS